MPLRDHFHPPLSDRTPWDSLHGGWPMLIAMDLNKRLPGRYVARPAVHLGAAFEIDIATSEYADSSAARDARTPEDGGGVATQTWAPPTPSLAVATGMPDQDEYEVRIFETEEWRLVAAIEIVSPANKDRPDTRQAFAAKCATLLRQRVSVSIIDLVTVRRANLYSDLLDLLGQSDPSLTPEMPSLYAASCRWHEMKQAWHFETWTHVLEIGKPLPTLPLWLASDLAVPLNLESTYEETCRALRMD